jgi:hypothetical protein
MRLEDEASEAERRQKKRQPVSQYQDDSKVKLFMAESKHVAGKPPDFGLQSPANMNTRVLPLRTSFQS